MSTAPTTPNLHYVPLTKIRSSPAKGCSRPPLKKNVTCGYFSVSAARNCVSPAFDTTSPKELVMSFGGNTLVMNSLCRSLYCTMPVTVDNTGCWSVGGSRSIIRVCNSSYSCNQWSIKQYTVEDNNNNNNNNNNKG